MTNTPPADEFDEVYEETSIMLERLEGDRPTVTDEMVEAAWGEVPIGVGTNSLNAPPAPWMRAALEAAVRARK